MLPVEERWGESRSGLGILRPMVRAGMLIAVMGTAHAFAQCIDREKLVQRQKLTVTDAMEHDAFGDSVSVGGNTVVLGTPFDDCALGNSCGAAHVFPFDGTSWIEEQKLTASDIGDHGQFGRSVSVSGDTVVVSAPFDDCTADINNNCGAA